MDVRIRVLGSLEVERDRTLVTPSANKLRQALGLLALNNGHAVETQHLIGELWGDNPPASARSTLQTYVHKVRRLLFPRQATQAERLLQTGNDGYALVLPTPDLDLSLFERHCERAQATYNAGDFEQAIEHISRGLALWRGQAFSGIAQCRSIDRARTALEESRMAVIELRIDAELRLGRLGNVVEELRELIEKYPLHEGFHSKLMVTLHRLGRTDEALLLYRRLSKSLVDGHGLDPSNSLQRLSRQLAERTGPRAARTLVAPTAPPLNRVPAQLPYDTADLCGREAELHRLERQVSETCASRPQAPVTTLITGLPGVGKTALAVHAAHGMRKRFPDGQLFADLRGSSGEATPPSETLYSFLRALGVPHREVPASLDRRAALFRSILSDRRVLVVLDDACSAEQVRPLLPGTTTCAVLVSSATLLVSPGAMTFSLSPLSLADSTRLLTRLIGPEHTRNHPEALVQIARRCGGLPLALRAVGTRVAASRNPDPALTAHRLSTSPDWLDELRFDTLDVAARYREALRNLGPLEHSVLRELATALAPRFTTEEAAEVLGCNASTASVLLGSLSDPWLLWEGAAVPGEPQVLGLHPIARESLLVTQ